MSNQAIEVVGNSTMAALWADIAAKSTVQEPPPGAMSIRQFADKYTDGRIQAATNILKAQERAGRVRCEAIRVVTGGQMRTVRFFIPVHQASKGPITKRL